jgi:hypothetical protein
MGLELRDRLRERGLGDVQPPRGSRDLPLLGDGDELLQLPRPERHLTHLCETLMTRRPASASADEPADHRTDPRMRGDCG